MKTTKRLTKFEIEQREKLIDEMAPDATHGEKVSMRQLFARSGDTMTRVIERVIARRTIETMYYVTVGDPAARMTKTVRRLRPTRRGTD